MELGLFEGNYLFSFSSISFVLILSAVQQVYTVDSFHFAVFLFSHILLIPQSRENKNTVKTFFLTMASIGVILKIVNLCIRLCKYFF